MFAAFWTLSRRFKRQSNRYNRERAPAHLSRTHQAALRCAQRAKKQPVAAAQHRPASHPGGSDLRQIAEHNKGLYVGTDRIWRHTSRR